MNIIELEEGLRNLIALQPNILSGQNGNIIEGIKNIIDAHKTLAFQIEQYSNQDLLKVGMTNELTKLEMTFVSYACQTLGEHGINIMLYVPKFATFYNQEIMKYVDAEKEISSQIQKNEEKTNSQTMSNEPNEEKYIVVEENKKAKETDLPNAQTKNQDVESEEIKPQTKGRDYLMELLKK